VENRQADSPAVHVPSTTLLAHIKSSSLGEASAASKYCRYLPVSIGGVNCAAPVDSGNLWRNAISEELMTQLGISRKQLLTISTTSLGTAKKGAELAVLGELPKPIALSLGAGMRTFLTQPVVIRGLTMRMNISGPFLKMHDIDQLHSKNCLQVGSTQIPLLHTKQAEAAADPVCFVTTTTRDMVVPPLSGAHIPLTVLDLPKSQPAGAGLLTGGVKFMERTNLHPWIGVITDQSEGKCIAGLLNTTESPIMVRQGTVYGIWEPLMTNGKVMATMSHVRRGGQDKQTKKTEDVRKKSTHEDDGKKRNHEDVGKK
jgi:hypothetical protein